MAEDRLALRTVELDRRHRRYMRWAVLLSLLFHVLLILIFGSRDRRLPTGAAAGPRSGDDRAAAGGGMQAVTVRPIEELIIRPPDPIIVPDLALEVVEIEPEIQPVQTPGDGDFGLAGNQLGPADGPGLPGGDGAGDGGDQDEGRFRSIAPAPRTLLLAPPNRPANVRGTEVRVLVFVDETGRVVADSTRLVPPTGNANFDREIRQRAAQWQFDPAKRGGRSIAAWAEYTLTF